MVINHCVLSYIVELAERLTLISDLLLNSKYVGSRSKSVRLSLRMIFLEVAIACCGAIVFWRLTAFFRITLFDVKILKSAKMESCAGMILTTEKDISFEKPLIDILLNLE